MAIRTISSPGVEINEVDKSIIARPINLNSTFACGFANQGPTDEIVSVGSLTEFEDVFGVPSNAAERYFYHSCKQILTQAPASLFVTRFPYGSGAGDGFANQHSALIYPIKSTISTTIASLSTFGGSLALSSNGVSDYPVLDGYTTSETNFEVDSENFATVYDIANDTLVDVVTSVNLSTQTIPFSASTSYYIQAPHSVLVTDTQYDNLVNGGGLAWQSTAQYVDATSTPIENYDDILKYGGLVVLDSVKTTINNLFEGYYVALADNSENNPASDFTA